MGLLDIAVRHATATAARSTASRPTSRSRAFQAKSFPGVFIRSPLVESTGDVEVIATHEGRAVAVRQGHIVARCAFPRLTKDLRLHHAEFVPYGRLAIVKIRSAGLLDLARIEEMHRASDTGLAEAAPPRGFRLWSVLSSTLSAFLLPLSQETLIYASPRKAARWWPLSRHPGQPLRPRPGARHLSPGASTCRSSTEPIRRGIAVCGAGSTTCARPGARTGRPQAVRAPSRRESLLPVFRLRGFRQYATEVVVYADKPLVRSDRFPEGARPIRRGDHRHLYQLYKKVTPQGVAARRRRPIAYGGRFTASGLETPRGARLREAGDRDRPGRAWSGGSRPTGARGPGPNTLSFMAQAESARWRASSRTSGISLLGASELPAWSSLRHYDSHTDRRPARAWSSACC